MKTLFLKIFSIFWIAQSLIAILSTVLILSHRAPDGGASVSSLEEGLKIEAQEAFRVYQEGGCHALRDFGANHHQRVLLLTTERKDLCDSSASFNAPKEYAIGDGIFGSSHGSTFSWRVPLENPTVPAKHVVIEVARASNTGALLRDIRDFGFPQLPIILAVGGATTFLLVLLVTRPLSLLSEGAKAMANGDLSVRVPQSLSVTPGGDAFQTLISDFNSMAHRIESLVEAHQLLLRDVSHELRSPLTRLHVALGLARNHTEGKAVSYLDRVEKEADQVNAMIGELLSLSAMEVSADDHLEHFCIRELLQTLLTDAQFEAALKACTICLEIDRDYPLHGNRDLLLRALENVIRNAVRYTKTNSEIMVRVRQASSDESFLVIEVLDHGPGIPEADLQAIFRPFYRTDGARNSTTGGFGVGLAIAERAVELHGGRIVASNRSQGGMIVSISLPWSVIMTSKCPED